jgi:hypothetical protein
VVLTAGTAAGIAVLADRGGPGGAPTGGQTGSSTSPAPPPPVPAVAGDPCGWQQQGDLATASDGRTVTCVQVGDDYRWQVS